MRVAQAARRLRAFCTDGRAAFVFASARARTSTDAGFAAIVISSPVAGLRPWRAFVAGFTRTVSWTRLPILTFSALPTSSRMTSSRAWIAVFASVRVIPARSATASASWVWVSATCVPLLVIGFRAAIEVGPADTTGCSDGCERTAGAILGRPRPHEQRTCHPVGVEDTIRTKRLVVAITGASGAIY